MSLDLGRKLAQNETRLECAVPMRGTFASTRTREEIENPLQVTLCQQPTLCVSSMENTVLFIQYLDITYISPLIPVLFTSIIFTFFTPARLVPDSQSTVLRKPTVQLSNIDESSTLRNDGKGTCHEGHDPLSDCFHSKQTKRMPPSLVTLFLWRKVITSLVAANFSRLWKIT